MIPRVKICGLTRPADAEIAAQAGALYVGAILVDGSPRTVSPTVARSLHEASGLPLVVVVADRSALEAALLAEASGASVIQLHGDEQEADLHALRGLGEWELWKAVRVRSGAEVEPAARRWTGIADGLLLDTWDDARRGGTGKAFPWDALEAFRPAWPAELALVVAGGLTPENVTEAVRRLHPNVVDVSSGVEHAPGLKDPERIRSFVEQAGGT